MSDNGITTLGELKKIVYKSIEDEYGELSSGKYKVLSIPPNGDLDVIITVKDSSNNITTKFAVDIENGDIIKITNLKSGSNSSKLFYDSSSIGVETAITNDNTITLNININRFDQGLNLSEPSTVEYTSSYTVYDGETVYLKNFSINSKNLTVYNSETDKSTLTKDSLKIIDGASNYSEITSGTITVTTNGTDKSGASANYTEIDAGDITIKKSDSADDYAIDVTAAKAMNIAGAVNVTESTNSSLISLGAASTSNIKVLIDAKSAGKDNQGITLSADNNGSSYSTLKYNSLKINTGEDGNNYLEADSSKLLITTAGNTSTSTNYTEIDAGDITIKKSDSNTDGYAIDIASNYAIDIKQSDTTKEAIKISDSSSTTKFNTISTEKNIIQSSDTEKTEISAGNITINSATDKKVLELKRTGTGTANYLSRIESKLSTDNSLYIKGKFTVEGSLNDETISSINGLSITDKLNLPDGSSFVGPKTNSTALNNSQATIVYTKRSTETSGLETTSDSVKVGQVAIITQMNSSGEIIGTDGNNSEGNALTNGNIPNPKISIGLVSNNIEGDRYRTSTGNFSGIRTEIDKDSILISDGTNTNLSELSLSDTESKLSLKTSSNGIELKKSGTNASLTLNSTTNLISLSGTNNSINIGSTDTDTKITNTSLTTTNISASTDVKIGGKWKQSLSGNDLVFSFI